jgi:hypothetical protein
LQGKQSANPSELCQVLPASLSMATVAPSSRDWHPVYLSDTNVICGKPQIDLNNLSTNVLITYSA